MIIRSLATNLEAKARNSYKEHDHLMILKSSIIK
jgi:hypothetical protein